MKEKRKEEKRMTMDPFILDTSDPTINFTVDDREDNPIEDSLAPSAVTCEKGENYLKQAFLFLIRGDWQSAEEYCDKELEINPNSADAYLGKLMAELHVSKEEHLSEFTAPFNRSENYEGIRRSGNWGVITRVDGYLRKILERQKEDIYSEAKRVMNSAKTNGDFQRAETLFEQIKDYKDAAALQIKCRKIINGGDAGKTVNWKTVTICAVIAATVIGIVVLCDRLFFHKLWHEPETTTAILTTVPVTTAKAPEITTVVPTTMPVTTTKAPEKTTAVSTTVPVTANTDHPTLPEELKPIETEPVEGGFDDESQEDSSGFFD